MSQFCTRIVGFGMLVSAVFAAPARAADVGKASGTATINGATTTMAFAAQTRIENLFDDKKKDTLVVLTDRALGVVAPDDEVQLSLLARKGEVTVIALRIDGTKLTNVTLSYKGMNGVVKLPGAWFQYAATNPGAGTLKLPKHDFDGASYAMSVEFAAAPYAAPKAPAPASAPSAAAKPAPKPEPAPAAAPATTSNIDPKARTPLLIQAMMQKDEHQAVEIIKLGADPNGRDQYGVPVLNWAVMMCQPAVVQALVDRKADLKYERAPGMTILTEAGACPEAAKILRAAGAR